MERKLTGWRALFIGALVAMFVLLIPAVASADAWLWWDGGVYYWTGQDGNGTILCAERSDALGTGSGAHGTLVTQVHTYAKQSLYCADPLNEPTGYITSDS